MLNVHFNLPFFWFYFFRSDLKPISKRFSKLHLNLYQVEAKSKTGKKKKKRNPTQTHTHTNTTQQFSSTISPESLGNHAICSIPMIILEWRHSFAVVFLWTLPSSPTELGSEAQCNTIAKGSWIWICQCTAPLVFSTCYWVSAVKLGLRWPPLAHHPLRVHKQGLGLLASCSHFFFFRGVFTSFTCNTLRFSFFFLCT